MFDVQWLHVARTRFELATSGLKGRRANQLHQRVVLYDGGSLSAPQSTDR